MRETRILRRKLFFLQSLVLAIFCLALAAGVSIPLYLNLSGQVAERFMSSAKRQSATVSQYLLRAEELAGQITSRTRIRQELEKFNRGEITLDGLVRFTAPKLKDALQRSNEVMGITRLDARGRVVLSLGIHPPDDAVSGKVAPKNGAGLGNMFQAEGRKFIWVRAPILNRQKKRVGYDIVVVSTSRLDNIIGGRDKEDPNNGLWVTFLSLPAHGKKIRRLHVGYCRAAKGDAMNPAQILEVALRAGGQKAVVSFKCGNLFCVAAPVEGSDWFLVSGLDLKRMYEPIVRQVGWVLLIALGIYLLCLAGYWLALNPLSKKLLLRQDELEKEIGFKTRSLESELLVREKVEAQLASERKRLANILEGTNAGTWEWNVQTGEVVVNRRWAEMLGYTVGEIFPVSVHTWEELCHPQDLKEATRQLQRHFRRETDFYQVETRMRHKNGSWVWIYDRGKVASWTEDGQPLLMYGTHQDVTKRKLAEQALQESGERLRILINSTPDIICFKDGEGRLLEANRAIIKLFSLEGVDYQGKKNFELAREIDTSYSKAILTCQHSDEKAWQSGKMVRDEEEITDKDGSLNVYDVIKVPLFEKDGRRKGLITLGRDVTQRKIAEEAKRRLQSQLRQAHKMQAVGTLAGGIAHDFNNILAAIMGYAELAMEDAEQGRPTPMELDQIMKSAERAKILVRQILTFSRKMGSEKRPLDLNKLVMESASVIRRTIPKMISTEAELGGNLPVVPGDSAQIQSVLLNLATNARDAMPEGGRIIISTGQAVVEEKFCNACGQTFTGDYAVISVSDNGQGMDRDTIDHMFDPFFTTKEVGKGTGLGMATVFGILSEHKGHVVCDSAPGRGSTFHIYLPAVKPGRVTMGKKSAPASAMRGRGEKILVVDDEEQIRGMARSALTNNGYEVITAEDGEQALEIYRQAMGSIDLVILDLSMPGMGGGKCLDELLKLNPGVKVLLASGYALEDNQAGAAESRAAGYLTKPYRISELLEIIRELLE